MDLEFGGGNVINEEVIEGKEEEGLVKREILLNRYRGERE